MILHISKYNMNLFDCSGAELLTANLMVVVPILVISHAVTLGIG